MPDDSARPVYIAFIELVPLDGCELSPSDYGGAFVRCYAAAETKEKAIERISAALQEDRFGITKVEWCVDESSVEWDEPNDATATALISEAKTSEDVVFGEFHTWPPE